MGYRIVKPYAEEVHECDLPWSPGGYGSTGLPDRTVVECDQCHTFWYAKPWFESLGNTQRWARVRWYHFRLRREHGLIVDGLL